MNTPQTHEEKKQELNQLQEISNTDNLTALLLLQAQKLEVDRARLDFQTEMLKHLKDAEATKEATKWVQELNENNQEAKANREAEQQEKARFMNSLNTILGKNTEPQESIDISD